MATTLHSLNWLNDSNHGVMLHFMECSKQLCKSNLLLSSPGMFPPPKYLVYYTVLTFLEWMGGWVSLPETNQAL